MHPRSRLGGWALRAGIGLTAATLVGTFTTSPAIANPPSRAEATSAVGAAAFTPRWMVPTVLSVEVVSVGQSILVRVNVRSSPRMLQGQRFAYIEVQGGGDRCITTKIGGTGQCSLLLPAGTASIAVKARANVTGQWKAWSKPRTFTITVPDPDPDPEPPADPTGFISLNVIGPPSSCNTNAGPGGLQIPIEAQGPAALPMVLTQLDTRLEVPTGTYSIRPGEFVCAGVRYTPLYSPVEVNVQRVITTYAFLNYKEAPTAEPPSGGTSALAALATLEVSSESGAGYDRDLFAHWSDADGDGCDTRQEVLIQEATSPAQVGSGCRITSGGWTSAFDGIQTQDPSTFDVDHFVPLAEAWGSGASRWDAATRQAFANDLGYDGSLIAVSASSNRSKGDSDPAEWLPPKADYICTYVLTWVAVKYRWSLSVDFVEKSALERNINSCGNPSLVLPSKAEVVADLGAGDPGGGGGGGGLDPRFPTCAAAKAAGYGPYYRDRDPEYYWYRDADKDGIVCE